MSSNSFPLGPGRDRAGTGDRELVEAVEQGSAQLVETAVRELHLSRAVFPMPASPRSTRTPLWPAKASVKSRSSVSHSARRPMSSTTAPYPTCSA